jgi:hypothetical protein
MRSWIIVPALALLILFTACGGGGGGVNTKRGSASPAAAGGLCGLLPNSSVEGTAGYQVALAQEHSGPGTLHFCTIFLAATGCSECALSLEDLGSIDANAYNDSDSYRATLIAANPDAKMSFQESVVGEGSWLAAATGGAAAGLKILYFKVGTVAYDLTSPRVSGGLLTAGQMVSLAQIVVQNGR